MLPRSSFDDIYFPMTADLYYGSETQNDFGQIELDWIKNREVRCSSISSITGRTMGPELRPDQFIDYSNLLYFRTNEDIRVDLQDQNDNNPEIHALNLILVSNIKDDSGVVIYRDYNKPTIYEVATVVPSFSEFQRINYFRVFLRRSQDQGVDLWS